MYCPICGNRLEERDFEREPPEPDWATATKQMIDKWAKKAAKHVRDDSIRLVCPTKSCFGDGFELLWHHPLKGMKSGPGDSWSLTWLK